MRDNNPLMLSIMNAFTYWYDKKHPDIDEEKRKIDCLAFIKEVHIQLFAGVGLGLYNDQIGAYIAGTREELEDLQKTLEDEIKYGF